MSHRSTDLVDVEYETALVGFLREQHIQATMRPVRVDPSCDDEGFYIGIDTFTGDEMSVGVANGIITVWHHLLGPVGTYDINDPRSLDKVLQNLRSNLGKFDPSNH